MMHRDSSKSKQRQQEATPTTQVSPFEQSGPDIQFPPPADGQQLQNPYHNVASATMRRQNYSQVNKTQQTRAPAIAVVDKDMYLRSTSEIVTTTTQVPSTDCIASDTCIWKRRFMQEIRKNEQIKQKFKECLTVMETRISSLTADKINMLSDKQSLEDQINQQKHALKKQYAQVIDQKNKISTFESQLGGTTTVSNSPMMGETSRNQAMPQIFNPTRQSDMVQSKNRPLHSEIGMATGRREQSQWPLKKNSPILVQNQINSNSILTEDTSSVRVKFMQNNFNLEATSIAGTIGTPAVMIVEEQEQDGYSPAGRIGCERPFASDFSLSNAADVNLNNGEITPLRNEDGNLTADDIVIECGKSSEGVGERNNPFEQHGYTHQVDSEESPPRPINKQTVMSHSQTMKNVAEPNMFKDELLKETPSFIEIDNDRGEILELEISRKIEVQTDKDNQTNNHSFNYSVPSSKKNNPISNMMSPDRKYIKQSSQGSGSVSPVPPLVSSKSKQASMNSNKWIQTLGVSQNNKITNKTGSWRNLYASAEQTGAFIDQSEALKSSQNTIQRSVNLLQSQEQSSLNQPHEMPDSDEIELKDSEEDGDGLTDDNSDDCEFNSLEGNTMPCDSRVPKTQTKFNQTVDQLNQMNRLDVQNLRRVTAIQQKMQVLQLQRITEEDTSSQQVTLQTTNDLASTMNKDSNRMSERYDELKRINSESATTPDILGLYQQRSSNGIINPVDLQSSTAIIIDDDEDEKEQEQEFDREDDCLERDESYADVNAMILDGDSSNQQQQESNNDSFQAESDIRNSDMLLNNKDSFMYVPGQLEPLEAVPEDGESQVQEAWDPSNKSESIVQFNPRFSSLMSERDSTILNFNNEKKSAFFQPKSFSQIAGICEETGFAPSQSVVEVPTDDIMQPQLVHSASMPVGYVNNDDEDGHEQFPTTIDENIDGEESKETALSQQRRINGGTIRSKVVNRDRKYTYMTASENDNTSQVNTGLENFNSRQRVTEFEASKLRIGQSVLNQTGPAKGDFFSASSIHTLTRGNDSVQTKNTIDGITSAQIRLQEQQMQQLPSSFPSQSDFVEAHAPVQAQDSISPLAIVGKNSELKSSFQSSNAFYPIAGGVVEEAFPKVVDAVDDMATEIEIADNLSSNNKEHERKDDDFLSIDGEDLGKEPVFFDDLAIAARNSSHQSTSNQCQPSSIFTGKFDEKGKDGQKSKQEMEQLSEALLMNRSMHTMNNQLQKSMFVDNRRTSEAFLMHPTRSSMLLNFGYKGKQSQAMHKSIVNPSWGKSIKGLAATNGAGPFGKLLDPKIERRLSNRSGTLRVRNKKSINASTDSDEKQVTYEPQDISEEFKQKALRMTKNQKQNHFQHKSTIVKNDHNNNNSSAANHHPLINVSDTFSQSGVSGTFAKTAESGNLASGLAEFDNKGKKQQQFNIMIPLSKTIFQQIPDDCRKSFVSLGNSSPIVEESTARHNFEDFTSSPQIKKYHAFFQDSENKAPVDTVAQSVNLTQMNPPLNQKEKNTVEKFGGMVVNRLNKWGKEIYNNLIRPEEEDLLWFARLLELKTIQSEYFFEKYMVVGLSDETLSAALLKSDFKENLLKPSILFREPIMTRAQSNFNEKKYLIDDDTVDIIADFCFPNGVPVISWMKYTPGVALDQQPQKTQEIIHEIFYRQKNLREDMFFFQLDASDAVELKDGESIYGDCHLVALVHTFSDFKELNGKLYLVKSALCVVTTTHSNFGLIQELLYKNMVILQQQRMEFMTKKMEEQPSTLYPQEIQSCLQVRFEDPPDEFRVILERVRTYKVDNPEQILHSDNKEFTYVELDEGQQFNYEFPRSLQQALAEKQEKITIRDLQLDMTEHYMHLPTFFSLFGPNTFYKLLTAVLLERSIVFVHSKLSVISSVIMSLKTLLRPFMWCHSLIPVLPRALLDHILQPLPVLVGITQEDYVQVLQTTHPSERRYKTWIFLDWELAQVIGDVPGFMPFETSDEMDIDPRSGIRIIWGTMDQEFSQDYRYEILLGWLDEMQTKALPFFDSFEHAARSDEELQAKSVLPNLMGSLDMEFVDVRALDHNRQEGQFGDYMDTNAINQNRISLGEKIKSNRKKPSQSMEFAEFHRMKNERASQQEFHRVNSQTNYNTGTINRLSTEEEMVLQRDSQPDSYAQISLKKPQSQEYKSRQPAQEETNNTTQQTQPQSTIQEDPAENTVANQDDMSQEEDGYEMLENPYMPIVNIASASDKIKKAIEQICLQLARTYKTKIIDLVPEVCRRSDITEADQVFDSMIIADKISELSDSKDQMFLEQFAYTQMFSFLLENYMAALNQKQLESEMGDTAGGLLPLSRQSDYILSKFGSQVNLATSQSIDFHSGSQYKSGTLLSGDKPDLLQTAPISSMDLQVSPLLLELPTDRSSSKAAGGKNELLKTNQQPSLRQILDGKSGSDRPESRQSSRNNH